MWGGGCEKMKKSLGVLGHLNQCGAQDNITMSTGGQIILKAVY